MQDKIDSLKNMETAKEPVNLIPNTTQVPHIILREWMPKLSDTELRVLLVIVDQTLGWIENPITKRRKEKDWISYSQLEKKTGRYKQALTKAIRKLERLEIIEVLDYYGQPISVKNRAGRKLFYRLKTGVESTQDNRNLGENRNSKITHTKETNTKDNAISSVSSYEDTSEIGEKPQKFKKDNRLKEGWQYYALEVSKLLNLNHKNRARIFDFAKNCGDPYWLQKRAEKLLKTNTIFQNLRSNAQVGYLITVFKNSL